MRSYVMDAPEPDTRDFDPSQWPLEAQLLGHILDTLSAANWQRGGGKGPRPTPTMAAARQVARPAPGINVREILSRGAPRPSDN